MRCHHIYVEDAGKVFIPGCMTAAVHGPHVCVCYPLKIHGDGPVATEIEELRRENKELHRTIMN